MILVALSFLTLIFLVAGCDILCYFKGGRCVDWRYHKCLAGFETGLCAGDSNRRCCLECGWGCKSDEVRWAFCCDSACTNNGGVCQDDSNYCDGSYSSGSCGGPSGRKCCGASSTRGRSCTLKTYSSTYIKGYNGLPVKYEPGFKSSLDTLANYARICGVTVWVTHAYRKVRQSLHGTLVPPAVRSNHLVGHAIDFNLATPNEWCNGSCLSSYNRRNIKNGYYKRAMNFIQKVMDNNSLRWGGVFNASDPVHIDDGLNLYNDNQWVELYKHLQKSC